MSILSLKVMNNKKILITGVTGLLGSWLAEKLLEKNCSITGLALNSELDFLINSKKINNNIDMHYFDISEEDKLLTIFNKEYDSSYTFSCTDTSRRCNKTPNSYFQI